MANIFISYGHDLYEPLVSKLSNFLVQHGNVVFKDDAVNKKIITEVPETEGEYKYIRPTQRYDIEIDNAIQNCDLVISVLSQHSTRPNGVCLDEIARAREFSKDILPLRVEKVRAPFLICRIQWIELIVTRDENGNLNYSEEDSKNVFEYILKIISGEQKINDIGISELEAILTSEIFDFTKIITEKTKNFVGRKWLFDKVENWVNNGPGNVFLITGKPGSGKTAFAARSTYITHICNYHNAASTDVYDTLGSLAYQLSNVIDGYAEQLMSLKEINKLRNKKINEVIYLLFVKSLENVSVPQKNIAVIIDAVDEMSKDQIREFLCALTESKKILPSWLKIILTSRPEAEIMKYFTDPDNVTRIDGDENTDDCINYLKEQLDELNIQYEDEDICRVVDYGESNFLYLYYLVNEIKTKNIKFLDAERAPRGINEYYAKAFNEIYGGDIASYESKVLPVFQILCAAKGDINRYDVAEILDVSQIQISNLENSSHSFVDIKSDGTLAFFHKTVKDWLTDFNLSAILYVDEKAGSKQIVRYMIDAFTDELDNMPDLEYIKKYGLIHIVECMETKLFMQLSKSRNQEILSCLYYSFKNISAQITAKFIKRLYNIMSFQAFNKVFDNIMDIYIDNNMFYSVIEICSTLEKSADSKLKTLIHCVLCTTYRNMDDNKNASLIGEKALLILENIKKHDEYTQALLRAKVYQVNGDFNLYSDRLSIARKYYEKSEESLNRIMKNKESFDADDDIKINVYTWLIYCYGSLGYLDSQKNYTTAELMYKKELDFAAELVEIMPTLKTKLWLAISCNDLVETSIVNYNYKEAKKYAEESIRISENLVEEYPLMRTKRNLAIAYGLMGTVCRKTDDFEGYFDNYEKGFKIILQLKNEFPSQKAKRDLALAYKKMAKMYSYTDKEDITVQYIQKSIYLFEELSKSFPSARNKTSLAEAYMDNGVFFKKNGKIEEAIENLKKSLEMFENLEKEYAEISFLHETAQLSQHLGGIYFDKEDFGKAFKYHEKFYLCSKKLEEEGLTPSSLLGRVYSCISFSGINFILGNKGEGIAKFSEAMNSVTFLLSAIYPHENYVEIFDELNSDLIPIKEKIRLLNGLVAETDTNQLLDTEKQHLNNFLTYIKTFTKFFD